MKQHFYLRPAALLAMMFLATLSSNAQIFFEDFQNGMPANFTLINVDGNTPHPNVSYVNAAWAVLNGTTVGGTIGTATDSFAVSTSWYSPAGQANDWMITPAITLPSAPAPTQVLRWRARSRTTSFLDGYEVRISTTGDTIPDFTDVVFSTPGEVAAWTSRQVDLTAYEGQTIYIAFRNNSNDQELLFVDDIEVTSGTPVYNVSIETATAPNAQYTLIPQSQGLLSPFTFEATVVNTGFDPVTNVSVSVELTDEAGNSLFTDMMGGPLASLAAGDTGVFVATGTYMPTDTGFYIAEYVVSLTETDLDTTDNVFFTFTLIADSTYARDDLSQLFNAVGIGAGAASNGIIGQSFDMFASDQLTSVTFGLNAPSAGQPVFASIHLVDPTTGNPILSPALGTTSVYTITAQDEADGVILTLPMLNGPLTLNPGFEYFVGVNEADSTLSLLLSREIFTPGKAWVYWNAAGWRNSESFGSSFTGAYLVRPNFNFCVSLDAIAGTTPDNGGGSGSAFVLSSGGTPPYSISWSNGASTDTALFLPFGVYSVTVTDARGCAFTIDSVDVSDNTSIDEQLAGIDALNAFPNPSTGRFSLEIELAAIDDLRISIMDVSGRVIFAKAENRVQRYNEQIDLGNQSRGVYVLRVQTSKGIAHRRLIAE